MDGLARIEPAARSLMREVDAVLATLGAPSTHPVWALLRRLKTTPADAVAFFAEIDPARLRAAGAALRDQASQCLATPVPTEVSWQGAAGAAFAAHATALADHLAGGGAQSLVGRLSATASYVEDLAAWYERSRAHLARVLAEVLSSAQAVTVRTSPGLAHDLAELSWRREAAPKLAVIAAAEIGAAVLAVVAQALDEGHEVRRRWAPGLAELPYPGPREAAPVGANTAIDLHH